MRLLKILFAVLSFSMTTLMSLDARTWYVGGGGADFSQIQPAIDAATHGDIILVRPGTYSWFSLTKGAVIRASSTRFRINNDITVHNIPVGQTAVLSGVDLRAELWISSSQGEVRLEDMAVTPGNAACVHVDDCSNVAISSLAARGSFDFFTPHSAGCSYALIVSLRSYRFQSLAVQSPHLAYT